MRYRKQRNNFICGPMGIYNALKKVKQTADIKELIKLCRTDRDGSWRTHVTLAARKFFRTKQLKCIPKPWKGNQTYLVSVKDWDGNNHIVTLIKSTEKSVFVTNWWSQSGHFCHTWVKWDVIRQNWENWTLRLDER